MDTLYTFWDNTTHFKTKSVKFLGLMNSATKFRKAAKQSIRMGNLNWETSNVGPLWGSSLLGVLRDS